MSSIVSLEGIEKSFGKKRVLKGVDLRVDAGEVFGLLGPSGAGKTTLINILLGVYRPTGGTAQVFGKDPSRFGRQDYAEIGLMVEGCGVFDRFSCRENLVVASLVNGTTSSARIDDALEMVGLREASSTRAQNLSTGMRQRLLIARAFLNRPRLIVLDEPTSGLDPNTALGIRQIFRELRGEGTTILLATHNMVEAASLCDRVMLLDEGHVVESGTVEELCRRHCGPRVTDVTLKGGKSISLGTIEECGQELARLLVLGRVEDICTRSATLEDVFLQLTGKNLDDGEQHAVGHL